MPKIKEVKRMTGTMQNHSLGECDLHVVAVITGLYIGSPILSKLYLTQAVDKYVMAWNRWGHFIATIIFDVTAILVGYLYFFSRFENHIKSNTNKQNIVEFWEVFLNLITFNRRKNLILS